MISYKVLSIKVFKISLQHVDIENRKIYFFYIPPYNKNAKTGKRFRPPKIHWRNILQGATICTVHDSRER